MNAYFKIILFYHSFSSLVTYLKKRKRKKVISYHLKSIRWDEIISSHYCEENQDSLFVEGINGLYSRDVWYVSDPCDDIYESCCHSDFCEILIYYPESLRVYYRVIGASKADTLYLHGKSNIVAIKPVPTGSNPPLSLNLLTNTLCLKGFPSYLTSLDNPLAK